LFGSTDLPRSTVAGVPNVMHVHIIMVVVFCCYSNSIL